MEKIAFWGPNLLSVTISKHYKIFYIIPYPSQLAPSLVTSPSRAERIITIKEGRTFLSSHASLFSYRIFFGTMYQFQEFSFQRNRIFRHCRRRRGSRDYLNFIITILSPFQAPTASRSAWRKNTNQYPESILQVLKIGFGPHTSNLRTLWSTEISFVLHGPLKINGL